MENFHHINNEYQLDELCRISPKKYDPNKDTINYKCIELEHIEQNIGTINGFTWSKNQQSIKNKFNASNVLFGKLRPYLKKFYNPNFEGVCSSEIWVLEPTNIIKKDYLFYLIQSNKFITAANISCGSKMPRADWDYMKEISFSIPDFTTQTKIATFLNLYYKKIELQKKKIEQMEKLSFDALFTHKYDGKTYKLEQVLTEVNERTTQNNQYEVISSTKAGLYYQKDYFNKEIASEDNSGYKILKLNQVVISPQNLWLGNINYNDSIEIGIVSPSYKIFNINEGFNKTFISHLLKSKRAMYDYMISSEQGASVVRRNLNIELFNEIIFMIPDIETQNHIAYQLVLINNKINLEKQKLEAMEKYKHGLLQQLFI